MNDECRRANKAKGSELLHKLNRLSILYDKAVMESKPYRVGATKRYLSDHLTKIRYLFGEIIQLNSSNYSVLLGRIEKIEEVINRKEEAVSQQEYENAANLRITEKILVQTHLRQKFGLSVDQRYVLVQSQIYQVY